MIAPRKVIIDAVPGPQVNIAGEGGAPGRLDGPTVQAAKSEFARTQKILAGTGLDQHIQLIAPEPPTEEGTLKQAVIATTRIGRINTKFEPSTSIVFNPNVALLTPEARRTEMLSKWDRFSQRLLEHAVDERSEYWKALKTDNIANFKATVEPYREKFSRDVIGRWDLPLQPPQPRTRLLYEKPKWVGYEVVLDVSPM